MAEAVLSLPALFCGCRVRGRSSLRAPGGGRAAVTDEHGRRLATPATSRQRGSAVSAQEITVTFRCSPEMSKRRVSTARACGAGRSWPCRSLSRRQTNADTVSSGAGLSWGSMLSALTSVHRRVAAEIHTETLPVQPGVDRDRFPQGEVRETPSQYAGKSRPRSGCSLPKLCANLSPQGGAAAFSAKEARHATAPGGKKNGAAQLQGRLFELAHLKSFRFSCFLSSSTSLGVTAA